MTEPLVVTIPHKLGKAEALRRVKPALGKASETFPVLYLRCDDCNHTSVAPA